MRLLSLRYLLRASSFWSLPPLRRPRTAAVTMTPNLPNPGQLQPNFGNSVNVTLHTAWPCDQTSMIYLPQPNGAIIVDQSTQTTTRQADGTYPDLIYDFPIRGQTFAPLVVTALIFPTTSERCRADVFRP